MLDDLKKAYARLKFTDLINRIAEVKMIIRCGATRKIPNELMFLIIKEYRKYDTELLSLVGEGSNSEEVMYQNYNAKYIFYIQISKYGKLAESLFSVLPDDVNINNCYGDKCRYEYDLLERNNTWCESCFGDFDEENYNSLLRDDVMLSQAKDIPLENIVGIITNNIPKIRLIEKMVRKIENSIAEESKEREYISKELTKINNEMENEIKLVYAKYQEKRDKLKKFDYAEDMIYEELRTIVNYGKDEIKKYNDEIEKKKNSIQFQILDLQSKIENMTKEINEKQKILETL